MINAMKLLKPGDLVSSTSYTRLYMDPEMKSWEQTLTLRETSAIVLGSSTRLSRGDDRIFISVLKLLTMYGIRYAYQLDVDVVSEDW